MTIQSKLPDVGVTIFTVMTQLAIENQAINLSQGFPDFDPPSELIAAAHQALEGGYHQYSVTWGSPRMRAALAKKLTRFMGLEIDPVAHLTITCGSTGRPVWILVPNCPCPILTSHFQYWIWSGRSSPNSALRAAYCSGVASSSPSSVVTGSPGMARRNAKMRNESTSSTNTLFTRRLAIYEKTCVLLVDTKSSPQEYK